MFIESEQSKDSIVTKDTPIEKVELSVLASALYTRFKKDPIQGALDAVRYTDSQGTSRPLRPDNVFGSTFEGIYTTGQIEDEIVRKIEGLDAQKSIVTRNELAGVKYELNWMIREAGIMGQPAIEALIRITKAVAIKQTEYEQIHGKIEKTSTYPRDIV